MKLFIHNKARHPEISVILLDWSVRESFHSLHYLNNQTFPRDKYELIWIEFYDREAPQLQHHADSFKNDLFVDKWIILRNTKDTYYHKHFMYNVGIALAEGKICVISDSDAMYQPTFLTSIHKAFERDPNQVVHVDQVRNENRKYYPFNYPDIAEVLKDKECVNWVGHTTVGLNNSSDMLHEANYGACMAARREDLIRIGGADEDLDYLGHICGPYELTFRLTNLGKKETWLRHEFLYHTWHPGQSGHDNYGGPHDRNVSLRALEARESGLTQPSLENLAIKELRNGNIVTKEEVLKILEEEQNKESWRNPERFLELVNPPQLVKQDYFGFNIIYYKHMYYGLSQDEGAFVLSKVLKKEYKRCYAGNSMEEVLQQINTNSPVARLINQALTLSIIFSFRNEALLLEELVKRARNILNQERSKGVISNYELIFVNDDSTDKSENILTRLARGHKDIKIITMSRSYGVSQCVLAGMEFSKGDLVIYMDPDLGDPPEVIPQMIKVWQNGNNIDVVHAVRIPRNHEPTLKLLMTSYEVLKKVSSIYLPRGAGDFKLLTRRAVNHLVQLKEKKPFLRALVSWIGFNQTTITYHREKGHSDKTKTSALGWGGIRNFLQSAVASSSSLPLYIAGFTGVISVLIGFLVLLIRKYRGSITGGTSIVISIILMGIIQLLSIGVIGMYLANIMLEVKRRPNYIVKRVFGFDEDVNGKVSAKPFSLVQKG